MPERRVSAREKSFQRLSRIVVVYAKTSLRWPLSKLHRAKHDNDDRHSYELFQDLAIETLDDDQTGMVPIVTYSSSLEDEVVEMIWTQLKSQFQSICRIDLFVWRRINWRLIYLIVFETERIAPYSCDYCGAWKQDWSIHNLQLFRRRSIPITKKDCTVMDVWQISSAR